MAVKKAIIGGVTGPEQFIGRFVANSATRLFDTIISEYNRTYNGSIEKLTEFLLSEHWYMLTNRRFDGPVIRAVEYSVASDQKSPVGLGNTILTLDGQEIDFFDQTNCDLVMPDMLYLITPADRLLTEYLPEPETAAWKAGRRMTLRPSH